MTLEITHFLDDEGVPIVSIPLTNIQKNVILFQDTFNLLLSMGLDPRWKYSRGQVVSRGKQPIAIARLVADAKVGEKIQYLDRDPCNLRRDNLVTALGAGRSKTRDKLAPENRKHTFLNDVELKHIHKLPSWEIKEQLEG